MMGGLPFLVKLLDGFLPSGNLTCMEEWSCASDCLNNQMRADQGAGFMLGHSGGGWVRDGEAGLFELQEECVEQAAVVGRGSIQGCPRRGGEKVFLDGLFNSGEVMAYSGLHPLHKLPLVSAKIFASPSK
jgi:hypothetical protein